MKSLAALAVAASVLAPSRAARAEGCVEPDARGRPMVTCFDPGNRLRLDVGTGGVGVGVDVRQSIATDDPHIHYRLEHGLSIGTSGPHWVTGTAYALRFVRHSDEGRLVVPTSPPRQLALPFDLGVETSALTFAADRRASALGVGVVRVVPLADFARSRDGRLRVAFGPVLRWDAVVSRERAAVLEHDVAPFSLAAASLHVESRDGLTLVKAWGEAGWEQRGGAFRRVARGEITVERVVLALNDRPLSLFAGARSDPWNRGASAEVGLRFAPF